MRIRTAKQAARIRSGIETCRIGGMHAVAMIYGTGSVDNLWMRAYMHTERQERKS